MAALTASMSLLMLSVVSITKQRALLEPLEIPIILGDGERLVKQMISQVWTETCGVGSILQERSVPSSRSDVLQQLAGCSYGDARSFRVEMSVAGPKLVFVDTAFRIDAACLINSSAVAAFTFYLTERGYTLLMNLLHILIIMKEVSEWVSHLLVWLREKAQGRSSQRSGPSQL